MFISDMRKGDYKLPDSVQKIDLSKKLHEYNEANDLVNIADEVDKYFSNRKKEPHTAAKMVEKNKWSESGIKPEGESFGDLDIRIRRGLPFDTNGWVPNDIISGNKQHNRSNTINFNNIITHLNLRNGLFWQAMNITLVVYYLDDGSYKLITVIGNHCTAKSIIVNGRGARVFARVISLGKNASLSEIRKFGAIIHHTDSDRRTNQGANDRLISGVHAGEEQYMNTMKVLVDMGFDMKNQVKQNGLPLKAISSAQSLMSVIKEYKNYDMVKENGQLIRATWPEAKKILVSGLSVLCTIRHYFPKKVGSELMKEFITDWAKGGNEQEDLYPNSTNNKDIMVPTYDLIKSLNKWYKKKYNKTKVLISRRDIFKAIPEDLLVNI